MDGTNHPTGGFYLLTLTADMTDLYQSWLIKSKSRPEIWFKRENDTHLQ